LPPYLPRSGDGPHGLLMRNWTAYLVRRQECFRTTWTARLLLALALLLILWLISTAWVRRVGTNLVCEERRGAPADVIVVENFDPNYLVFERAAELRTMGLAQRVLVPTRAASESERPNDVSTGTVELMARIARLSEPEILPIRFEEPISLNAAYQLRSILQKDGASSIIVVVPGFRSRRSVLVYGAVLEEAGVAVSCSPVFGLNTPANWTQTWHGIQEVLMEYGKLQYYRWYVLPRARTR
jgi:hypothetical protein